MGNIIRRLRWIFGLAALATAPLAAQPAEPPPLAAYGKLPAPFEQTSKMLEEAVAFVAEYNPAS